MGVRKYYFISYNFTGDKGQGYGRTGLSRNSKIRSIEDIEVIEEVIRGKNKFKQVSITNWKLYE